MSSEKVSADSSSSDLSEIRARRPGKRPRVYESSLPVSVTDFNENRGRLLTTSNTECSLKNQDGCVIYWMSRDQRAIDNHALVYAQKVAEQKGVPLKVVFNLVPKFLDATIRHFGFMLKGLEEVESQLREKNIPFYLTKGHPVEEVPKFASSQQCQLLVCDFSPLRVPLTWSYEVASACDANTEIPVVQVDAHNIVPVWIASPQLEYGAKTLRGKLDKVLSTYLKNDMPPLPTQDTSVLQGCDPVDWKEAYDCLEVNRDVKEVNWLKPGYSGAMETLNEFTSNRLKFYGEKRNDPNEAVASNMSPYFHFGQISAQRVILHVKGLRIHNDSTASFVEESVVRRELSDNFCFYNHDHYDSIEGAYGWAQETLMVHRTDAREFVYPLKDFEEGNTHDDLWNAAQLQLNREGKMHGFLRMYWAKKILEWTESPEQALQFAIYLNDKYSLDGRDPNGYVGCMWSICGIHDQGWGERPVFGKIRFMNYKGCERKFKVKDFVAKYPPAKANAEAILPPPPPKSKKGKAASVAGTKSVKSFFKTEEKK